MPQFTRLEVFYKTNVTIYNCEHTELRQVFGTKHTVVSYRFGRTRHEQSPATCAKELSINFSLPNYSHTNSKHSETIFSPTHHTTRDLVHENVVSSYHSSVHVTPAWGRIPHGFSSRGQVCPSPEKNLTCVFSESFDRKGNSSSPFPARKKKTHSGPLIGQSYAQRYLRDKGTYSLPPHPATTTIAKDMTTMHHTVSHHLGLSRNKT